MARKLLIGFLIIMIVLLGCGTFGLAVLVGAPIVKNYLADRNIESGNHDRDFPKAPSAVSTCTPARLITDPKIDQVVFDNLDDGDPWAWTLTIVNPADDLRLQETVVELSEPGHSFDIVYDKMIFSSYRLEGSQDEVLCFLDAIGASDAGYHIYVGNDVPKGWYKPSEVSGAWWNEMTTWTYTEEPVDSGEAVEGYIEPNASNRMIAPDSGLAHGQFWRNGQPGIVVYPVVEAGYEFSVADGYQGSFWSYNYVRGTMFETILQSSRFAVVRDDIKVVVMPFCGNPENIPGDNLTVTDDQGNIILTADWLSVDQQLTYTLDNVEHELTGFTCEKVK